MCIGNFDGVHRGHARMLAAGRRIAVERHRPFVIMTFDPHPMNILKPTAPRPPLMTLEQRLEALESFSPDAVVLYRTNAELLDMTAEAFMAGVLREQFAVSCLVEGANFTFGKGAAGTVDTLMENAARFGWEAMVVPTQEAALADQTLVNVSSSLIRWLVGHGRMQDAAVLLGRPFTLRGQVEQGDRRGRLLGYPTVNLQTAQLIPADGVYGGWAVTAGTVCQAAVSIGTNPTFQGQQRRVEAFLLDFDQDLYGRTVDLAFAMFVRDQQVFADAEALRRQIAHDVRKISDVLKARNMSSFPPGPPTAAAVNV